jgi:hypothetical protein
MPLPVVAMPVLPPATDRRVTRYRVPDESRPNTEQAVPVIKRSILIRGMTPAVSPPSYDWNALNYFSKSSND